MIQSGAMVEKSSWSYSLVAAGNKLITAPRGFDQRSTTDRSRE